MSYPGYPQQNWQQQGHYPPVPPAYRQGSPTLSVMGGIVGLGLAGVLLCQTIMLMSDLSDVPEIPGGWTAMQILHFTVAALGLLGAILVFARQVAGAVLLMLAAIVSIAVLVLDPVMAEGLWFTLIGAMPSAEPTGDYSAYFQYMVEFGNEQAVLRFIALVLSVILLVIAMLPPSLTWLRGSRKQGYSPYPPQW